MPPKLNLYKGGKNPSKPAKLVQQHQSQPSTSQTTEIPNQEQFEVELYWCIQQLQKALASGKLNNKQVQDHTKALNTLMNNTAPLVKKRQVMRLSFGDYREKMALEEKKITRTAAKMNFKPATPNKKTVFLKKSMFSSSIDNKFKFNFNIEEENTTNENVSSIIDNTVNDNSKSSFLPSNNSFRFDFQVEPET